MVYKIIILKTAEEDIAWLRKNDKRSFLKCFNLINEISISPRSGIGKPERLRYFDKEVYSRRVNLTDRIIYTIYEEEKEIDISSCRGHHY